MKAVTFEGPFQVAVKEVADPEIKEPTDAIIKVTAAPICGSDLHVYNGRLPIPLRGWVLGHEYIGVIEEVGGEVSSFARGDRVVGSFVANCGQCFYCQHGWPTQCLKQQHLGFGQVPGAQAQYLRVPFAPTTLAKVPDSLSDEDAVCAGDVLATGYFAAEEGNIQPGDTVVVVGCGAVGLYSIMCARLFQPATIIALDSVAERLAMAERLGALPVNVEQD
ncbi:MAG TPA: alcohol dehydrogenase catalytic domain-containing protein, partial [Dehalococcoidia bacterium]|nr:alcohol dehydrogenase catalytic domain-containing protein [Dehalococcoidia bacterium]